MGYGSIGKKYPDNYPYLQGNPNEGLGIVGIFERLRRISYYLFHKTNSINYLFDGCKKLKTIKMSSNFGDIDNLIFKDENNEVLKKYQNMEIFIGKRELIAINF